VHYRHEGEAGPAIVFLHEAPLSSAIYSLALPLLGRSLRAWAFSDPPPRPPSIEEYGATVLEAIDALGIDRFVLAGCHTGVDIGLEVARQAGAGQVTHAVLSGVPLLRPGDGRAGCGACWAAAGRARSRRAGGRSSRRTWR
jgi:pimeloyl-ACP methyl ester carboxylesterase